MSRNPIVVGLAFLGGFFLFVFFIVMTSIFLLILKGRPPLPKGDKIGVIEVKGLISSADEIVKNIRYFVRHKDIKAILVRIDSPGGTVGASQEIYEALLQARKKKPVVASIGSIGASGALYAALGAQKILAMPGSITGSIGVMMQVPNVKKLLDKIGIEAKVLKSGPYKDAGSIFRPLKEKERQVLMQTIQDIYNQFVEAIVKNRKIPREKVLSFADGRVFTGRQALRYGLIDSLGNFETAVEEARKLAHIKGEPALIYPHKRRGWLRKLLGEEIKSSLDIFLYSPLYLAQTGG